MFPSRGGCPAHHVQRELAERSALILYASHLATFAKARKLPKDSLLMFAIEGCMIEAIEKGIERDYGPDVVFACGAAFGACCNTAMILELSNEAQLAFLQAKNSIIRATSAFVAEHFQSGIWHLSHPKRSCQDYEDILQDLWERWMSLPIAFRLQISTAA